MSIMGELVPRAWAADLPLRRSFFRDLSDLHRDLESLFDGIFGASREGSERWPLSPCMESYVEGGKLVVRCDLPGVEPRDVEVSLEGNRLAISGERKAREEAKDGGYLARETRYGRFERVLAVPEGIDPEKVTARYAGGVLEVTMPLPPSATGRKVPIQVEEQETRKAA